MLPDEYSQQQLQLIFSGAGIAEPKDTLHATRNFLCASFKTSTTPKKDFGHQQKIKEEQEKQLIRFAKQSNILNLEFIDESLYLTEGGEAKIYFSKDAKHVLKLNDAIYYTNWLDFLNGLCIHNILFPETGYELLGFIYKEKLVAVLKQNYVVSTQEVNLLEVEEFLNSNGFMKVRKVDYYNQELGIRLEDIHDENIIKQNDCYFFIDTVFYIDLK